MPSLNLLRFGHLTGNRTKQIDCYGTVTLLPHIVAVKSKLPYMVLYAFYAGYTDAWTRFSTAVADRTRCVPVQVTQVRALEYADA
jgi:hypothetical protein